MPSGPGGLDPSPLPSSPAGEATKRSFDLSGLANQSLASDRTYRHTFVGAAVFLVAAGAYAVSPLSPSPGVQSIGFLILLWFLAAVLVAMARFTPSTPAILRVEVGEEGVRVDYATGPRRDLRWNSPDFGLTLYDYSTVAGTKPSSTDDVRLALDDKTFAPIVSEEVMDALVDAADERGIPVLVREEIRPARGGSLRMEVTRIGAAERTPGWRTAKAASRPAE